MESVAPQPDTSKGERLRSCACGCGRRAVRGYLPLHDHRAVQELVRRWFGGSTTALIRYIESMAGEYGIPDTESGGLRPVPPPLAYLASEFT